jgi:hypothetical protein
MAKIHLGFAYLTRPLKRFGFHIGTGDVVRNRLG